MLSDYQGIVGVCTISLEVLEAHTISKTSSLLVIMFEKVLCLMQYVQYASRSGSKQQSRKIIALSQIFAFGTDNNIHGHGAAETFHQRVH